MKQINLYIILIVLCITYNAKCSTWFNISPGYWDNPIIWQGGISPPYSLSDTIIINYPVAINENITLNNNSYIFIDSLGGICGHHNITVLSGARILKLGILEIDSLKIPGGIVNCLGNGEVILTLSGIISNGGSFSVNGCPLSVGPWFNCVQPSFAFTLDIEEIIETSFTIFPNPAHDRIQVNSENLKVKSLEIYNLHGQKVKQIPSFKFQNSNKIDVSALDKGIYLIQIQTEYGIENKKLVIQ